MTRSREETLEMVRWCELALDGVRLRPEEAAVFLAAARVLLPGELAAQLPASPGEADPAPEPLCAALRALLEQTGKGPHAPAPMPEHAMAPGLLGACWQRLRAAWASTEPTVR